MAVLLIAEKPSVAQDIAEVIAKKGKDKFKKREGFLEGDNYLISWAVGHLLELAMPEQYSPEYEKWDIASLPIFPQKFRIYPKEETRKQLNTLMSLLKREDIEYVINACDAGREGELIFRYIIEYSNCRKPQKRLWLSETTDEAVWKALKEMKDAREYDSLAMAAKARAEADWLVGINATRAYSVKYRQKLSLGRVQTPTLALIVKRDQEIDNFKPVPYFQLEAELVGENGEYKGAWFRNGHDRFASQEEAGKVKQTIGQEAEVMEISEKEMEEKPPLFYNLNDLQRESNKIYGYSAKETLDIAQSLYEAKLITYPRTDCRYLTSAMASTLPARLDAVRKVLGMETELNEQLSERYVNDGKVSDHTAIIPTVQFPDMSRLTEKERNIYLLVAKRFLAAFSQPARIKKIEIITSEGENSFLSRGKTVINPGWKILFDGEDEAEEKEEISLPPLQKGDRVKIRNVNLLRKIPSPPKRYTEAELLSHMENIARCLDSSMRDYVKEKGLGTPATRAIVIEKLISTGYIERRKKNLLSTEKGRKLIAIADENIRNPELTAEWEEKLLLMEKGEYSRETFDREIKTYVQRLIEKVKADNKEINFSEHKSLGKCPLCGRPVIEVKKSYSCSGWKEGCKFTIWKEIAGKRINENQVKKLLDKGVTDKMKGFKKKDGSSFDAALALEDGKVVFKRERR